MSKARRCVKDWTREMRPPDVVPVVERGAPPAVVGAFSRSTSYEFGVASLESGAGVVEVPASRVVVEFEETEEEEIEVVERGL